SQSVLVNTRIQHKLNQVSFYLNSNVNITINSSNTTTKVWFFVIDITTLLFNLNFIEGKAPDISNVSELIVTNIRIDNNRTR
ncbi:MAG: hypothetical protein PUB03_03435, partial [bacterium]|nr:hypothetical protein [bacterium]